MLLGVTLQGATQAAGHRQPSEMTGPCSIALHALMLGNDLQEAGGNQLSCTSSRER